MLIVIFRLGLFLGEHDDVEGIFAHPLGGISQGVLVFADVATSFPYGIVLPLIAGQDVVDGFGSELVKGFQEGNQFQTLLGVTGSGKTFTMANIIQKLNKPTLIIAHNKTLAAQLYSEFKAFFPNNAVEYFVSYYDYYQPEAYVPSTDTYIEKDSAVNDEIDKLRHSATAALIERKDVIVVSSVSCIYGIGSKEDYTEMMISLRPGMQKDRDDVGIVELVDLIAEPICQALDRALRADAIAHVAHLQVQVLVRKERHAGAEYARDVHAVVSAQMQFAKTHAVDFFTRDENIA